MTTVPFSNINKLVQKNLVLFYYEKNKNKKNGKTDHDGNFKLNNHFQLIHHNFMKLRSASAI